MFDPRSIYVRFVVDKVALRHVFFPVLLFSPVSIIPQMIHNHIHLHVSLPEGLKGEGWETSNKEKLCFGNRRQWVENNFQSYGARIVGRLQDPDNALSLVQQTGSHWPHCISTDLHESSNQSMRPWKIHWTYLWWQHCTQRVIFIESPGETGQGPKFAGF